MNRTTLARKAVGLAVGVTMLAGLSAFSATSASADCQLEGITTTPDLQGVLCSSGEGGGGSGAPGSPTKTGCLYDMAPIDDDWGDFFQDEYTEKVHTTADGSTSTTRIYEKDGKETGSIEVTVSADNQSYGLWAHSRKLKQAVSFNCRYSEDGPTYQDVSDDVTSDTPADTTPAAPIPSLPTGTPVSNPVTVTDWATHVAGTANDYVVKLGFTNTGSTSTYVDAALDMTSLSAATVISGPADYSCGTKAGVELCDIPELAPGATTTLFLRITAPAAIGNTIPVTVLNDGSLLWQQSAAHPASWKNGPVEQTFLVTRP